MHARNTLWAAAVVGICGPVLAQTAPTSRPSSATTSTSEPDLSSKPYDDILKDSDRRFEERKKELQETGPATSPAIAPTTAGRAEISPIQPAAAPVSPSAPPQDQGNVVVTSDLDAARNNIAPPLGAQTYTIGAEQIATTPGGENATGQQVLLRAPGVVEDSYGQEHVRGEHANLTYRVNGVILPEGLNAFGQELDTHLIQSVTLIDGSLPAQFGFRTAGIVDVQTKSGEALSQSEVSFYGGSNETYQPTFESGGAIGKVDYFVTGTLLHNDLGIENTTGSSEAIHDNTNQQKIFAYLSYHLDDTSRVSLLVNASNADFQIPGYGRSAGGIRAGRPPERQACGFNGH